MSDLASLFDAAEQAAVGGDFAAAARLLADAARIQETTLGPDHLDLANTLNNLAVAHERSGRLDDAEREYRRAHAIAARALPADDPLVTTSAQNLREFCQANGRPIDTPALRLSAAEDAGAAATVVLAKPLQADVPTAPIEPLAMTFAPEPAVAAAPAPRPPAATKPVPTKSPVATPATPATIAAPAAPAPPRSRLSIPVLVALGAAAALVIWLLTGRGPAAPPARPEAASPDAPLPAAGPAAVAPSPGTVASAPAAEKPVASTAAPAGGPSRAASPSATAATTAADGLTVDEARLCAALSAGYQCQAAGATVAAGRLTFYTRLAARSNTSVVHRWYRGSELRQSVRLQVPARRQGFRTYSRATVSPSEGEWRVELRARDGQLLHVERFTVR